MYVYMMGMGVRLYDGDGCTCTWWGCVCVCMVGWLYVYIAAVDVRVHGGNGCTRIWWGGCIFMWVDDYGRICFGASFNEKGDTIKEVKRRIAIAKRASGDLHRNEIKINTTGRNKWICSDVVFIYIYV